MDLAGIDRFTYAVVTVFVRTKRREQGLHHASLARVGTLKIVDAVL